MVWPMDPSGMRARLMLAPRWVLALYYGVFFGVFMGLFTGIRDSSALGGVAGGLVGGLFFSAFMTPFTTRMRERMRVQMGGLSPERLRAAQKPSWRGPTPSDPAVRADALVIAHETLRQAERFRSVGVGLFGVFLALQIVLVATGTYSAAWTIPVFLTLVALYARWPGHMKKRVALLEQPS